GGLGDPREREAAERGLAGGERVCDTVGVGDREGAGRGHVRRAGVGRVVSGMPVGLLTGSRWLGGEGYRGASVNTRSHWFGGSTVCCTDRTTHTMVMVLGAPIGLRLNVTTSPTSTDSANTHCCEDTTSIVTVETRSFGWLY